MFEKVEHINNFFKGLEFEELSHRYSLNSKPFSVSVSGIIKNFVAPFDKYGKSLLIAQREGCTQREILDKWDDKNKRACELGTRVHSFAEHYAFNRSIEPTNGFEKAVVKLYNTLPSHIVPVIAELRMYHKKYEFAGTCDKLFLNTQTNNFILPDYKTNENLFKNFGGQRLLGCFSDLLDNNFNKYQIQLSLYQLLFEQTGLKVEERRIIHLLPDGDFIAYKTEDYTDRLQYYLENDFNKIKYESN